MARRRTTHAVLAISIAAVGVAVTSAGAATVPNKDLLFLPNVTAYQGASYGEPAVAVDPSGQYVYETTPGDGGAVLARSTDAGRTWKTLPTVKPQTGFEGAVGTGGSDSEIAVADNGDVLTGDLQLGSTSAIVIQRSTDHGDTFTETAAVLTSAADREWLAVSGAKGEDVYLVWHDLATGTMFEKSSHDGGLTFPTAPTLLYSQPQTAAESAHNGTSIGQVSVFGQHVLVTYGTTRLDTTDTTYGTPPISTIHASISDDAGATFHDVTVNPGAADANLGNFWMSSAFDSSGEMYSVYSGYDHKGSPLHVWIQASKDDGVTWTTPTVVDDIPGNALFGWVAGGGPDTAVVAWYQTTAADKDADGIPWSVEVAQVRNQLTGTPVFLRGTASDHVTHVGGLCTLGLFCGVLPGSASDRSLLDFFKVVVEPKSGYAEVVYSDNGAAPAAEGTGAVTFSKQFAGLSAFAPLPVAAVGAPAVPPAPAPAQAAAPTASGGSGTLASTGLPEGLAAGAVLAVAGGLVLRRRRA